jgi:hypothetical protein
MADSLGAAGSPRAEYNEIAAEIGGGGPNRWAWISPLDANVDVQLIAPGLLMDSRRELLTLPGATGQSRLKRFGKES